MTSPASCWATTTGPPTFRSCGVAGQPLTWTHTVPADFTGVAVLNCYRDANTRSGRLRINGGSWFSLLGTSPSGVWETCYTSSTLAAGVHTFELEWVESQQTLALDWSELTTTAVPSTTSSTSVTTTTAPATTTTTVPPTTTTTLPRVQLVALDGWADESLPMLSALVALTCGALLGTTLVKRR